MIGIVIGIILIVLIYICRGTLNIVQEMPSEFGVAVLGQVHVKRPRSPLVRGWRRLTSRKKALPLETEQQIAITNLKNFCKNHQVDRLLLTGSRADMSENEWLNEVRELLQKDQIEAAIIGGLPDSPSALEELNQYSCIVLVETLRTSIYKDVVREMELCADQEKQVAGAIVMA
ncbi:MAG: hypothetical protein LUD72_14320 [Bacteroidales bacterium]|nr:hypothetical protein [Bacteroidales bacterium]